MFHQPHLQIIFIALSIACPVKCRADLTGELSALSWRPRLIAQQFISLYEGTDVSGAKD